MGRGPLVQGAVGPPVPTLRVRREEHYTQQRQSAPDPADGGSSGQPTPRPIPQQRRYPSALDCGADGLTADTSGSHPGGQPLEEWLAEQHRSCHSAAHFPSDSLGCWTAIDRDDSPTSSWRTEARDHCGAFGLAGPMVVCSAVRTWQTWRAIRRVVPGADQHGGLGAGAGATSSDRRTPARRILLAYAPAPESGSGTVGHPATYREREPPPR